MCVSALNIPTGVYNCCVGCLEIVDSCYDCRLRSIRFARGFCLLFHVYFRRNIHAVYDIVICVNVFHVDAYMRQVVIFHLCVSVLCLLCRCVQ